MKSDAAKFRLYAHRVYGYMGDRKRSCLVIANVVIPEKLQHPGMVHPPFDSWRSESTPGRLLNTSQF